MNQSGLTIQYYICIRSWKRWPRRLMKKPVEEATKFCELGVDKAGFDVRYINDFIGYGVFTSRDFSQKDFLLEYRGELISSEEAVKREKTYPLSKGSFLYFFKDKGVLKCVDATDKHGKGRLVNDNHIAPNCKMIIVCKLHQSKPYLCLFATKDIPAETELRFDYGVANLPWRRKPLEGKENKTVPLHHSLDELSFCGFKKLISEPQPDEVTSNSGEQSEVLISEHQPDEVTSNSGEQSEMLISEPQPDEVTSNSGEQSEMLISEPQPDEVTSNSGEQSEVLISEPQPDEVTSNSGEQSEMLISEPQPDKVTSNSGEQSEVLISEPQPDEVTSNSGEQSEMLISEPQPDEVTSNSGEQSEVIILKPEVMAAIEQMMEQGGIVENSDDDDTATNNRFDNLNNLKSESKGIYISTYQKKKKRTYNKQNACVFCGCLVQVLIGRHLLAVHKDEPDVAAIHVLNDQAERKRRLDLLRNRGNFLHNQQVIDAGVGQIILMRRPHTFHDLDYEDYGPCPLCL
ncbi:uncharacterized protein [Apostichopus japonicus]|uniref:uncharacterized protein isoform X1 n=1 Tax=Stichopus japonicus TaxID=307972 RepID=UPI003AB3F065